MEITARGQRKTEVSLSIAIRQTGLSRTIIRECVARQMVVEPFSREDIVRLRRVRRLRELGVNLQGIEIILRMRQRIESLQAELERQERNPDWVWGDVPRTNLLLARKSDEEDVW